MSWHFMGRKGAHNYQDVHSSKAADEARSAKNDFLSVGNKGGMVVLKAHEYLFIPEASVN